MPTEPRNTVLMEDVQIIFRNFAGKETQYNREGDRNFAVLLPPDVAATMERDGWNVKYTKPREEGDEANPFLSVSLKYNKGRPPRVVMITSRGRTELGEDEVELLDYADIRKVDLIVNPYTWAVRDAAGIKAYLKTMFVTIEEDELERKYGDLPVASSRRVEEDDD